MLMVEGCGRIRLARRAGLYMRTAARTPHRFRRESRTAPANRSRDLHAARPLRRTRKAAAPVSAGLGYRRRNASSTENNTTQPPGSGITCTTAEGPSVPRTLSLARLSIFV